MCSRYSLTSPPEAVRATFGYLNEAEFPPRYNIAPTQPVAIVRNSHGGQRELALVRWGLIPSWAKEPQKFTTLINARSETAGAKPSFRASMRHRRCIVPADGFYEWTGKPGNKQPHMISKKSGEIMGFAGLWEHWLGADGSEIETMAILTTEANGDMAPIHDRMPVILGPEAFDVWLDCKPGSSVGLEGYLRPAPDGLLKIVAVSRELNNPRNDRPDVQQPVQGDRLL
ncbi:MAG: SOS response-associated peptidase [Alphaproteobacteria bacterium]|nr:SOS response-associated peptidase [Alphaproteobacteria bacterium]